MDLAPWAWLIVPLGVCRAMQIVLWDRITQRPREWLLDRLPDGGYLAYLLRCPWCVSVWLGLAAVALLSWGSSRAGALLVLAGLALSLAAVVLDRLIDRYAPDEPLPASPPAPAPPGTVYGRVDDAPPYAVASALDHLTGDDTRREG